MGKVNKRAYFKTKKAKERQRKAIDGLKRYNDSREDVTESHDEGDGDIELPNEYALGLHHNYCMIDSGPDVILDEGLVVEESTLTAREDVWRDGRHVVELGVLADALSACSKCGLPLQLHHATAMINYGLSAIIKVPCSNLLCKFVNHVPTGKRHDRIWDANTKLASAMIHAGIGERQVNSLLSELNIPHVSKWTLLARQNEAGTAFNCVAEECMVDAAKEEVQLTASNDGLCVSVDGAWQKRGSGRGYDSLSGHCTMIGTASGKVLSYSVRSKFCKVCDVAKSKKTNPKPHKCNINWTVSSKSMEQDMVIQMVSDQEKAGNSISTIVADDDTTTISRLRSVVNPGIKKTSDRNHVRKNLTGKLYSLQPKHKSLSKEVINYLQKCINYMISQNQGNVDGISQGFDALSRHPFGDHSVCNTKWCCHIDDPLRKYKSLPYGRPLSDSALQKCLVDFFEELKHHSDKYANLGSTQANESLNKTIASKAPKAHFYSGTSSLHHRVAAGVSQKNVGHSYISKVNKKIGISPGRYTMKLATLRDIQARKRKAIDVAMAKKAKIRRMELKARRTQTNMSKEIREGTSYQSGISSTSITDDVTEEIPAPQASPILKPLTVPAGVMPVFFDLESTGLARTSHITQMAAVYGDKKWSTYVFPKQPISKGASEITGISVSVSKMYHHGKVVTPLSISCAIEGFLSFIQQVFQPVFLAGHNIKVFDCPLLFNALERNVKISEFVNLVDGFIDTKVLFKKKMPNLTSYAQENVYRVVTGNDYKAHDALEDVSSLQLLVDESNVSVHSCSEAAFDCSYVLSSLAYSMCIKKNFSSYNELVEKKILSKGMARKAAGSNLSLHNLKLAYSRNGEDGLKSVLSETCGKNVRVTNSAKIIQAVAKFFSEPYS